MSFDDHEDIDASYRFESAGPGRPNKREAVHRSKLTGADDTSYSLDKFYVSSTNDHDHDETMRIRLPKWVMVYLQDLVRDPRLPAIRSTHDAIRDAIVHRVKYLHDNGTTDADTDWIEREIIRGSMVRMAIEIEDNKSSVAATREMLKDALKTRNADDITMSLAMAQNVAEHIREPYRGEIREEIRITTHLAASALEQ